MHGMRRVLNHPATSLFVALAAIGSGFAEGSTLMLEDLVGFDAGAHHGVIVLGLFQFARALAEMIQGARRIGGRAA